MSHSFDQRVFSLILQILRSEERQQQANKVRLQVFK